MTIDELIALHSETLVELRISWLNAQNTGVASRINEAMKRIDNALDYLVNLMHVRDNEEKL